MNDLARLDLLGESQSLSAEATMSSLKNVAHDHSYGKFVSPELSPLDQFPSASEFSASATPNINDLARLDLLGERQSPSCEATMSSLKNVVHDHSYGKDLKDKESCATSKTNDLENDDMLWESQSLSCEATALLRKYVAHDHSYGKDIAPKQNDITPTVKSDGDLDSYRELSPIAKSCDYILDSTEQLNELVKRMTEEFRHVVENSCGNTFGFNQERNKVGTRISDDFHEVAKSSREQILGAIEKLNEAVKIVAEEFREVVNSSREIIVDSIVPRYKAVKSIISAEKNGNRLVLFQCLCEDDSVEYFTPSELQIICPEKLDYCIKNFLMENV